MSTVPQDLHEAGVDYTAAIHHDTYSAISSQNSSHKSHRVFITGASKGIGRATALSFARAGASHIAIAARSPLASVVSEIHAAASSAGHAAPTVLPLSMDVLSRESVEAAAKEVSAAFDGTLDILVNNAGYIDHFVPLAESDPDEWWLTWTTNMRGPYLVTRALLPLLLAGTAKTIMNLSSIGAHQRLYGASAYTSAKLALLRFTESLNVEYGNQGILGLAVHPGGIPTDLAKVMPQERHYLLIDTPELAADTIVFLTAGRRTWLAGRYVSCTWDMPELLSREQEIVEGDKLKVKMVL
ncbi:MAG: hypothetical protein M1819_003408 [Sarea resinae]|nr:MAG: hypothetical protein M1819_003408 [Sarea resinae]